MQLFLPYFIFTSLINSVNVFSCDIFSQEVLSTLVSLHFPRTLTTLKHLSLPIVSSTAQHRHAPVSRVSGSGNGHVTREVSGGEGGGEERMMVEDGGEREQVEDRGHVERPGGFVWAGMFLQTQT